MIADAESLAAYDVASRHADTDRQSILDLIRERGTLTLDEVCVAMFRQPNQLSGRVTELLRKGAIRPTGEKRRTRAGCWAKAYEIAPPPAPSGYLF